MPGMEQVEAAVGEADSEPMAAPPRHQIERMRTWHDLVARMQIPAVEGSDQLARVNNGRPDFAYDDAAGDIGEACGIGHAGGGGQRRCHRRHDSVAGPRHVIDLAYLGALDMNGAVSRDEHRT